MTLCVDETEIRDSESLNGINSMSHRHKHYILVISSALLLKLKHMENMILQNYSEQLKKKIFISIPSANKKGRGHEHV